jgi:catechol 2,3-dioxygenase-like lactoylglutathione lyase family enzyme
MTLRRMEHVGIVVDDLAAATEFFAELGLELLGEMALEGRSVDRIVGLDGVRTEVAMMQTPDGNGRLELVKFLSRSGGDHRRAGREDRVRIRPTGMTARSRAASSGRAGWSPHRAPAL